MPTISIYVKNEDYSKYLSIEKKSEWLHEALNKHTNNPPQVKQVPKVTQSPYTPTHDPYQIIKTKEDAERIVEPLTKSYSARKKK